MKKTITLISVILILSGCSVIDAYRTSKYDNNEYMSVTQIKTISQISIPFCDARVFNYALVDQLYNSSMFAVNYTQHIPRNEDTHNLLVDLHNLILNFKARYDTGGNVSNTYCRLKLKQISAAAEQMQRVIGSKTR